MELWFTEHTGEHAFSLKVNETLFRTRSPYQEILVLDTADFGRALVLDGNIQCTERDEFFYHEMLAHVPLMAHPAPERVLVVGGGDGGTVREVLRHPSVRSVVLCEIDLAVIEASRAHLPSVAGALDDARVTIEVADAVAYMREQRAAFDVILIDSTDPIGPGEGLFTEAFYRDARRALRPHGVLAAQTESPFALQEAMGRAYGRLASVFPCVKMYLGLVPTYGGQLWSWTFCSEGPGPLDRLRDGDFEALEAKTRYYNREVHRASFALPNFVSAQLAALRPDAVTAQ